MTLFNVVCKSFRPKDLEMFKQLLDALEGKGILSGQAATIDTMWQDCCDYIRNGNLGRASVLLRTDTGD